MNFRPAAKESPNALDNLRNLAGPMAPRAGHILHDGWVHPHSVGFGHCCRPDPCPPGPKTNRLISEIEHMKSFTIPAIKVEDLKILALVYLGFSDARREKIFRNCPS
jgi:hypothetical protein